MKQHLKKQLWPVGLFTVLYLAVAAACALGNGNLEFAFYIGVVVLLSVATLAVHVRVGLSNALLWCLSIWGLLHMIGGLVPLPAGLPFSGDKAVFYSLWLIPGHLKYDHVIHAYGFGAATWICWQGLTVLTHSHKPSFGAVVLCVLGGLGLGAVNEIIEFIAVLMIPETNVGGYVNTGWDLVSNLVGAVTAGVIIYFAERKAAMSL